MEIFYFYIWGREEKKNKMYVNKCLLLDAWSDKFNEACTKLIWRQVPLIGYLDIRTHMSHVCMQMQHVLMYADDERWIGKCWDSWEEITWRKSVGLTND